MRRSKATISWRARTAGHGAEQVAGSRHRHDRTAAFDRANLRQRREQGVVERHGGPEPQALLVADAGDDPRRRVERDQAALVDDRDPVGEALRLVHEVGHEDDRDAPRPDVLDELPRVAASLRVEAGRQLVEDRDPRVADEGQRDRQALLLAARQVPELAVALLGEAEALDQGVDVGRVAIEGGVEVEGLD